MFLFWLFLIPAIVLARPRGHHSTNKRQHVAINLGEKLNIEDKNPNELDIVRQEDDMIKSNLLPNMKDMMMQQQQAQVEENSGLKFPLSSSMMNPTVEINNRKPAVDEQQRFWLGDNAKGNEAVGQLPQIENDFHTKIEGEKSESKLVQDTENNNLQGESENSHSERNNENSGFMKSKMSHEVENEARERVGNEDGQDDVSRRDNFHENENFSSEDSLPEKELEDPRGKLTDNEEDHRDQPEKHSQSQNHKEEESAKRDNSHSYSMEEKPDGEISDVLKSVFGQNGDPNYPVERQF